MEKENSLQENINLFETDFTGNESIINKVSESLFNKLLDKYHIKDMKSWENVNADLIITDPPFGIEFSGKNGNYHRNVKNVVGGYVEWKVSEYQEKMQQLLECIKINLKYN